MRKLIYKIAIILISAMLVTAFSVQAVAEQKNKYNATVKNKQIFLNGKQLTKSASEKSQPVVSPDNKKVLFIATTKVSIKLGVVDIKTKAERIINIKDTFPQIMHIEWLSNSKAGVLLHINPGLENYLTYDINTGKIIDSFYGYSFIYDKSMTHILYILAPPHFSSEKGSYTVMLDQASLYKTDGKTALDNSLYPSASFKRIAFFEYSAEDKTKSKIVILSIENNKVKSKVKITWNKSICELKWKNDDFLSIGNAASYDLKKSKLTMSGSENK